MPRAPNFFLLGGGVARRRNRHADLHSCADSRCLGPEPELVIVINCHREIIGYCAGNDVSSRDIEGEYRLYLPQAKVYDGSCALGHGILLCDPLEIRNVPIGLKVERGSETVFEGETTTATLKRTLLDLAEICNTQTHSSHGVFLLDERVSALCLETNSLCNLMMSFPFKSVRWRSENRVASLRG